ncbi:Gag polyprotein [Bienertia sinuspersici]
MGEVDGDIKPSEIQLSTIPIWSRINDLPFKGRGNETNARMIGEKIGSYICMDKSENLDKSLRIRKVKIRTRGGEKEEFAVNYEKLLLFCFICGKLGHGEKECDAHRGDFSPKNNFGLWMKASPVRKVWGENVTKQEEEPNTCA